MLLKNKHRNHQIMLNSRVGQVMSIKMALQLKTQKRGKFSSKRIGLKWIIKMKGKFTKKEPPLVMETISVIRFIRHSRISKERRRLKWFSPFFQCKERHRPLEQEKQCYSKAWTRDLRLNELIALLPHFKGSLILLKYETIRRAIKIIFLIMNINSKQRKSFIHP